MVTQGTLSDIGESEQATGEVVHEKADRHYKIHHTAGDAEASFDLTGFGYPGRFREVLDKLNLPDDPEELVKSEGRDGREDKTVFVWANDQIMLKTSANPLTGEHGVGSYHDKRPGFASYIAIEGRGPEVQRAFKLIKQKAKTTEGWDRRARSYC